MGRRPFFILRQAPPASADILCRPPMTTIIPLNFDNSPRYLRFASSFGCCGPTPGRALKGNPVQDRSYPRSCNPASAPRNVFPDHLQATFEKKGRPPEKQESQKTCQLNFHQRFRVKSRDVTPCQRYILVMRWVCSELRTVFVEKNKTAYEKTCTPPGAGAGIRSLPPE